MRIIGGEFKRRRFEVPKTFKARPTTDFAKENLFNVLSNHIDFADNITALDLFAGTGSISIELVSRGCNRVVAVEKENAHYAFINQVLLQLKTDKCFPIKGDAFKYIQKNKDTFDLIFADPPYELTGLETIPQLIFDNNRLKDNGILVLEHGKNHSFEQHPRFSEKRVYGSVNFSFFR